MKKSANFCCIRINVKNINFYPTARVLEALRLKL